MHPSYASDLRTPMVSLRSRGSAIAAMAAEGALARDELGSADLRKAEANLDAPLLAIIAAGTDVPEGEAFTQSLRALVSRTTDGAAVVMPGAGHYLINTHAPEVAAAIDTWLTDATATALEIGR